MALPALTLQVFFANRIHLYSNATWNFSCYVPSSPCTQNVPKKEHSGWKAIFSSDIYSDPLCQYCFFCFTLLKQPTKIID